MFNKVKLPTTLEQFDKLVDKVVDKYHLIDKHHAAAIISVAIRHLPNDEGYTTYDYLGHSVIKNLANYVANHKGETLRHESQILQLKEMLIKDPNDAQARDSLQKAADAGHEAAKKILEDFGGAIDNVRPLTVVPVETPITDPVQTNG